LLLFHTTAVFVAFWGKMDVVRCRGAVEVSFTDVWMENTPMGNNMDTTIELDFPFDVVAVIVV
jgi:hypothetical protein